VDFRQKCGGSPLQFYLKYMFLPLSQTLRLGYSSLLQLQGYKKELSSLAILIWTIAGLSIVMGNPLSLWEIVIWYITPPCPRDPGFYGLP
jgi:hypothetical protein